MPLDFPNSPTVGQTFNGPGVTWKWDGVKWSSVLVSGGPYLPLSGGTLAGPLTLASNATLPLHAVPLQQFSAATAGGPFLPLSGGMHSIAESGAVGDGVTDDQPRIQAWLNTLTAGAEVLLQPGKWYYIHAASLTIPSNIVVRGTYNALDNNNASGGFFNSGGFLIDPTLTVGITMSPASSLKQCKVYRYGLTANVTNPNAAAAYAAWAAEAFYRKTNGNTTNGSTTATIPLSNTTGITVGMRVTGYGLFPAQVTAVSAGVSVTVNTTFFAVAPSGSYFRFGASLGIQIPNNTTGIVLEELTIIGFRTGIQIFSAQFFISKVRGDNVTNIENCSGGDTALVRDCEFLPLYGNFAAVQAGDGIFVHDGGVTTMFDNVFVINWQTGWHFANVAGGQAVNCGCESVDGAGYVNWWLEGGSQINLTTCHGQAGGIGFHIQDTSSYVLNNCSSSAGPSVSGNNIAHFYVHSTSGANMYGSIIAPNTLGNFPQKVPILISGSNNASLNLVAPVIQDIANFPFPTASFVQGTLPNSSLPTFLQSIPWIGVGGSGFTATLLSYWNGCVVDAGTDLAAGTITLPPYPMDCQTVKLFFNIAVTTLTINTSDGAAVGRHGNPIAGTSQTWIYVKVNNKWYCGG